MCLAVPLNHAYAQLASVRLSQAWREPLVIFNPADYPDYEDTLNSVFGHIKWKLNVMQEHDSAASLIAAIESGAGLAVVPESFSCMSGPRLKLVPLTPSPAPLVIGAVWVAKHSSIPVEGFIESAKAAALLPE